jgi:hypothetical protein
MKGTRRGSVGNVKRKKGVDERDERDKAREVGNVKRTKGVDERDERDKARECGKCEEDERCG